MTAVLNRFPLGVIVCGYEHGGTTLISEVLRQHPALDSGFEGGLLLADHPTKFKTMHPYYHNLRLGWQLTAEDLLFICNAGNWQEAYARLRERSPIIPDKQVALIDKTPLYMKELSAVLNRIEHVPCVAVMRDPRAVLYSWFKRSGLKLNVWQRLRLPADCERYCAYAAGIRTALQSASAQRIFLLRYEELCLDPAEHSKRLFDFLQLEYKSSFLNFVPKFKNVYQQRISPDYISQYKKDFTEDISQTITP